QKRQRRPADLGVIGDDDHLVGTAHDLPLRLDQEEVAVEQPLGSDAADRQQGLVDVNVGEHVDGQRSQGDAGPRIDVAAEHDQVRLVAGGEQVGDRQTVGDDL